MKAIKPGDKVRLTPFALLLYDLEDLIYNVKSGGKYIHIWEHPDKIFTQGEVKPIRKVHKTPEALIWATILVFCIGLTATAIWLLRNNETMSKFIQ